METLEEILIQGKESFLNSGGENFDMVPCLNDNDDHIVLLKSLMSDLSVEKGSPRFLVYLKAIRASKRANCDREQKAV
mgnify:CR=1 FL=1